MARIRIRPNRQDFQLNIQENANGVTVTCPSHPNGYNIVQGKGFKKELNDLVASEKANIEKAIKEVQADMKEQFANQSAPFDTQIENVIEKFGE